MKLDRPMREWRVTFVGTYGERWDAKVNAPSNIVAVNHAWNMLYSPTGCPTLVIDRIEIKVRDIKEGE
mgnify:CR=1 FL=1